MAAERKVDVTVIGSCFVDMICYVPRFPATGETIYGSKFQLDFGGKAANQCVMAQKLGARTAMVSKVGNDQFGKDTKRNFEKYGVNTDFISVTDKAGTGVTSIAVNSSGEPAFISLAGANKYLSEEDLIAAEAMIKSCPVMVCDKGIPLNIASKALQCGKKFGIRTLFNPSPKLDFLPHAVYLNTDIMVLNRDEGTSLTGISAVSIQGAKRVIKKIHEEGTPQVIITLGSEGAICSEITENQTPLMAYIGTTQVKAVDTTGAGDALIGALAFYISCYPQLPLAEITSRAVTIATVTVTVHGVQCSYPRREELSDWLFNKNAIKTDDSGGSYMYKLLDKDILDSI